MTASQKYELCLSVYRDIINGYSSVLDGSQELYIKHLTDRDQSHFQYKRQHFQAVAEERGLLSEEDYIEMLQQTGHWSREEEETYKNLNIEIKNLESTRDNLFLEAQRKRIEERIDQKTEERDKLSQARSELQVNTVENFAENKLHDFMVSFAFYKDRELSTPLFTEDAYGELTLDKVSHYYTIYGEALKAVTEKNIKRVGHSSIFLNNYLLAKSNPYYFFGKKVLDLTSFQAALCGYGNSCKNILEHSDNSMNNIEDIDDIIAWYAQERQAIDRKYNPDKKGKGKGGPTVQADGLPSKSERFEAIGVFEHNKEEFEQAARDHNAVPVDYKKAADALKKKLGKETLDAKDLVKMHE
jgi:hypothetical protein